MIKKIICVIQILVVFALTFASFMLADYITSYYNRQGVVKSVNGYEVKVIDTIGEAWVFYADDLSVGDEVTLKMYNGGTDYKFDDDEAVGYEVNND